MATKSMFSRATALLAAASMAASGLVATPAFATGADPANNIDQQPVGADGVGLDCSLAAYPGGVLVNTGSGGEEAPTSGQLTGTTQSFTPSIGNVASLDLCLSVVVGGDEVDSLLNGAVSDLFTFDVAIYTGDEPTIDDVVTTTTAELSLLESTSGLGLEAAWFRVDLADANLQPGSPYTVELTDPSVSFIWRSTCGGEVLGAPDCADVADAYPEGVAGFDARSDHGFRSIFEVGTDLAGVVGTPAIVCNELASLDALTLLVTNEGPLPVSSFDVTLSVDVDGDVTELGTARVEGPFVSVEQLPVSRFGIDPETYRTATSTAATDGGDVTFILSVDSGNEVTETNEDNDFSDTTALVECGPSALSDPLLVAGDGINPAVVEHGITYWSYDDLPVSEIAAGAQGFNTQVTYVAGEEGEEPIYATPAYGTPAYGTPAYGTPAYGTPAYGTPAYGTPAYGTPAYGTPAYGTPAYGSPAYGTPAYGTPAYGTPAYGTPAYGTPAYGTTLETLFDSLDERITSQIPLVAVPVNSGKREADDAQGTGWDHILTAHAEAYPELQTEVDNILAQASQDRTLAMVLALDPVPVVNYNDVDFSRVMNLSLLSIAIANVTLGDFQYDQSLTPGITGPCDLIEKTSHLTCADIIAEGFDPASLTMIQLQLFGYHMGSFPMVVESAADLYDNIQLPAEGSGNILFDTYLANTGFRDLAMDDPTVTLPTGGHYHVSYTPFGNLPVTTAFDDPASIIDCSIVACTSETTVADVEQAYAFALHTQVADLIGAMSSVGREAFDLGTAAIGLHSLNNLPWQLFDRDPLDLPELTGGTCPTIPLTMTAVSSGDVPVVDPTFTYLLAQGWDQNTITAYVDDVELPADAIIQGAPIAQSGQQTLLTATIDTVVPVGSTIKLVADVCASDTLGTWRNQFTSLTWDTFVSADDLTIVEANAIGDEAPMEDVVAAVEVVEQTEPDEGSDPLTRIIEPNAIYTRHITGPTDVDQFIIPVGQPLGDSGVTLEQGDFVHIVMAPPAPDGLTVNADGELEPYDATDLDLGLFVAGVSPLVDNLFGDDTTGENGVNTDDQAILPLLGTTGDLNDPYTSLAATPAYGTPAYGTPAYGTPAYGTPAYGTGYVAPARLVSNQRGNATEHVFTEILPGWVENSNELIIQVNGHLGAADVESYSLWFYVYKSEAEPITCDPQFTQAQLDALYPEPAVGLDALVADIPGSTKSLILYSEGLFAAEESHDAAATLDFQLKDYLAQHELVQGVVIDPMDFAPFRAAMTEWLTTEAWCEPAAANRVHGAARQLVLGVGDAAQALQDVVVVGGDDKLPFSRHKDHTTVAHELEHYISIFNQAGLWSPLTAAHAGGFFLSTNPMVTKNPRAWADDFIWIPDYSITRLYGNTLEVQTQLNRFDITTRVTVEDPEDPGRTTLDQAFATGEDFLSDGAQEVVDILRGLGVQVNTDLLHEAGITDTTQLSSAEDFLAVLASLQDTLDVTLLFQHADQSNLQSARGFAEGRADLIKVADTQALTFGRVVVAASCHFGENISDAYKNADRPDVQTWTEALAGRSATSYVLAHTTYGYGISEGVDLSEKLTQLAVANAAGGIEWGEATRRAMVEYFGTSSDYGEHQRKVLMSLTGSGLPWVKTVPDPDATTSTTQSFSSSLFTAQAATDNPVIKTPSIQLDPVTGLEFADLDAPDLTVARGEGCQECLVRHDVAPTATSPGGSYYEAFTNNSYGGADGPEDRPLVPKTTTVYDLDGRTVGGVVITDIVSDSATADGISAINGGDAYGVDFLNATTTVSSTTIEGASNALDVATRGPFANVRHLDGKAWITLPRGSARGERVLPSGDVAGTYRLDTEFEGQIYLVDPLATERRPANIIDLDLYRTLPDNDPAIETLGFTVVAEDQTDIVRAVVALLVDDEDSTGDGAGRWVFGELAESAATSFQSADGDTWTRETWSTGINVTEGATIQSVATWIVDGNGVVSFTERKGQAAIVTEQGFNGDDPELLVEGTLVDGWYVDEAVVTFANAQAGKQYEVTIDGEKFTFVWDPLAPFTRTITTDGFHEVTAKRVDVEGGPTAVVRFAVDASDPEAFLLTPNQALDLEANTYLAGDAVEIETLCRDAGIGIASCEVDPANTLGGLGEFLDTTFVTPEGGLPITLTATDRLGRSVTATANFAVISRFAFLGFFDPVKITAPDDIDLAEAYGLEAGDQYYVANGENSIPFKFKLLSSETGVEIGNLDLLDFTWHPVRLQPRDEPATACGAISKPGYRYMNGTHQFNAVTVCDGVEFLPGELWEFRATTPDGLELTALVIYE